MHFQEVALSLVQPGNHDDLVAHFDTLKSLCKRRVHFEPGVGRAFAALPGSFFTLFERRMKQANWSKGIVSLLHHAPSFIAVCTRNTGWVSTSCSNSSTGNRGCLFFW